MAEISQILERLVTRSEDRDLNWRTTAKPDYYLTTLGEVSVVVGMINRGIDATQYELEILDRRGRSVETLTTGSVFYSEGNLIPRQASNLKRLFESARRSALDVDTTLDELARQLDAIG